jgi:hypothetical protein
MANIFLVSAPGCGSKIAVRDTFNVCRATGKTKRIVLGKNRHFDEALNEQIPSYEEALSALQRYDAAESSVHNVITGWLVTHYADRLFEQFKDTAIFIFAKRTNEQRRARGISKNKVLSKLDPASVANKVADQIASFVTLVEAQGGQWRRTKKFVLNKELTRLNQRKARVPKDFRYAVIGNQAVLGASQ